MINCDSQVRPVFVHSICPLNSVAIEKQHFGINKITQSQVFRSIFILFPEITSK